jgi:hypothetical protein
VGRLRDKGKQRDLAEGPGLPPLTHSVTENVSLKGPTPPDAPDEGLTQIYFHNVPPPMDIDSKQPAGQEHASPVWAQ